MSIFRYLSYVRMDACLDIGSPSPAIHAECELLQCSAVWAAAWSLHVVTWPHVCGPQCPVYHVSRGVHVFSQNVPCIPWFCVCCVPCSVPLRAHECSCVSSVPNFPVTWFPRAQLVLVLLVRRVLANFHNSFSALARPHRRVQARYLDI